MDFGGLLRRLLAVEQQLHWLIINQTMADYQPNPSREIDSQSRVAHGQFGAKIVLTRPKTEFL
jgi:hypothetical protein